MDPNAHYSHEVVVDAAAAATGMVMVGFGHDALADEHSLGPIDVVVDVALKNQIRPPGVVNEYSLNLVYLTVPRRP